MPVFDDTTQTTLDVQREKLNFIALEYHRQYADTLFCLEESMWYFWNGKIYQAKHELQIMTILTQRMPDVLEMPIKKRREILDNLKSLCWIKSEDFNREDGLTFENGFLSTKTLDFFPHDKKRLSTILIDYKYEPDSKTVLWEKSLDEIFDNNSSKKNCLQEFFGYCLSKETNLKRALWLIGESDTGKSVILDTLTNLLWKENVSALPLKYFDDGQHIGILQNKLANISTETDPRVENYETQFKIITSGERLIANPKYLPQYHFYPFCKIVMAANRLPRIDDKSNAIYNRLLLIRCDKIFEIEKQDTKLAEKLKEELPGILNWAIAGLKRLRERGHFVKDQEMISLLEDLKLENNPVLQWANENIAVSPGKELEKGEVYLKYTAWAKENGYVHLGLAKFSSYFWEIFRNDTKQKCQRPIGTDRKRIWPGLTWKTETETKEEQVEEWTE